MKHTIAFLAAALCLASGTLSGRAAVFADFVTFDVNSETATGVLNGVSFTLECTQAAARPGVPDDGGVVGGVTNDSSSLFSSAAFFTPSLPLGDEITLGAASDFRITFAQPVSNLTFHVYQLQANRLSFTDGSAPLAFTILSSDGDLVASSGNTAVQGGPGGGDDASGSLFFAATFTEFSWTSAPGTNATTTTPDDGIRLQFSVAPEIPPHLNITVPGVQQVQLAWNTNHTGYILESAGALPAANWEPVTNSVVVAGENFSVTVDTGETNRFFRLRKN